jgi:hypothetical protein
LWATQVSNITNSNHVNQIACLNFLPFKSIVRRLLRPLRVCAYQVAKNHKRLAFCFIVQVRISFLFFCSPSCLCASRKFICNRARSLQKEPSATNGQFAICAGLLE